MDVVVVDDEPLARDRLTRLVEALGYEVSATAGSAQAALDMVQKHDPAVLLLDIEMPGGTGLSVAEQIAQLEMAPAVIFTTAYDNYALEAFDTFAAGYLLKPIKRDQLETALLNAQKLNKAQRQQLDTLTDAADTSSAAHQPSAPSEPQHITVRSHRGVDLIPISSIRCFLADSKYITVVSTEGEFVMDGTLKQLEQDFVTQFARVHRNAMVSTAHILGLNRSAEGFYRVRLRDIEQQPIVSRRYTGRVKSLLEKL